STLKGFPHVSADKRYFQYDDNTQFIPVGEDVGWGDSGDSYGGGTFDYDQWIPKMAAQGANFARYWMCPWYHEIEWTPGALGDYTDFMNEAWQLDYDLELARTHGVVVEVCLLN